MSLQKCPHSGIPRLMWSPPWQINRNIHSPAGTWGPASPSAGRVRLSAALSLLLAVSPARYPPGQRRDHWVVAGMMTIWKQMRAVKEINQLELAEVVAETNNRWMRYDLRVKITLPHHETHTYTFLQIFWMLAHTQKQLEPTCIKPSLTSFPPSTPCWRLLIWSLKEITWKGGDKMGKQTIQMNVFCLHTKHPWDSENHSYWTLPLEKKLQVDPLTWTHAQVPHGASLEPVGRSRYKFTDHHGVHKLL